MLSELQYQIIDDFAKNYIEDFLVFLDDKSSEKEALISLFECLFVMPPVEEIYSQLKNQVVSSIEEKELQSKAASGLEDLLLLFQGHFSHMKGNIGNNLKRYATDKRLSSNTVSDHDLVEGLREIVLSYIPNNIRPQLSFEKRPAVPSLQDNLAVIYSDTMHAHSVIVTREPFTHRTVFHQLYLFFAPYFSSYHLPSEWGRWVGSLMSHLNNLLVLNADAQSVDVFHRKPLDYLIEELPFTEKIVHKLAIEDVLRRVHVLYTHHGASVLQQQLEDIATKGYTLDFEVSPSYSWALLPVIPLLPSDAIFSNALKTSIKQCYQSPKIHLFSENDRACLEWLTERYISLSIPSWEVAMSPILMHKEALVRGVFGESFSQEALTTLFTLLETLFHYDRLSFETDITAQLDSYLLAFHHSLVSQGISSGKQKHVDLLTELLKKISASKKIKDTMRQAATTYEKTDIKGVYLAYLATLPKATQPAEAFNHFHKKIQLLLDKSYLLDFSTQLVRDVWNDISLDLEKRIRPYTWFWTVSSPLIYPIDAYQDISDLLNIKQQLDLHTALNGEKESPLLYVRYTLKLLNAASVAVILPLAHHVASERKENILYVHFRELKLSYTNEEIAQLLECFLDNHCCEMPPPTEKTLEHLVWMAHTIGIFLHERYPGQSWLITRRFLDNLKDIDLDREDVCEILNFLDQTGIVQVPHLNDPKENEEGNKPTLLKKPIPKSAPQQSLDPNIAAKERLSLSLEEEPPQLNDNMLFLYRSYKQGAKSESPISLNSREGGDLPTQTTGSSDSRPMRQFERTQ